MPKPKLIETGTGGLPALGRVTLDEKGQLTPDAVISLNQFISLVAQKLSRYISLGDKTNYARAGNLDAQRIEFKTPSVAGTAVKVDHSLKRVPAGWIVVAQNKTGTLASDPLTWSDTAIEFTSDATDALFTIFLF